MFSLPNRVTELPRQPPQWDIIYR